MADISNLKYSLKHKFEDMVRYATDEIQKSLKGYKYMAGVYGSYARKEYNSRSDLDICIVFDKIPDRAAYCELRTELDMHNIQVAVCSKEYFENSKERFARNLRKDFEVIVNGE